MPQLERWMRVHEARTADSCNLRQVHVREPGEISTGCLAAIRILWTTTSYTVGSRHKFSGSDDLKGLWRDAVPKQHEAVKMQHSLELWPGVQTCVHSPTWIAMQSGGMRTRIACDDVFCTN